MDFDLNEEQTMVRNMMRDFADREVVPLAREDDRTERFPWDIIEKMSPLGLLGAPVLPEYGGMGLDNLSYAIMIEEIGRASFSLRSIVSAHISLASQTILKWGNEEQKKRFLLPMTRGQFLGCFATTEPNVGSDVASVETTATLKGDEWVLNGNKMFITNGGVAGVALVFAQTDKSKGYKGITCFLVERDMPGFTSKAIHGKMGVRSSNTAELAFEDCRVPRANVLGAVGDGFKVAMSAFDNARMCVAAGCVGLGQACIDACVNYAKTRVQFGKPIGSFQLVQELIADMIVENQASRLMVYRAACEKNKGNAATIETSMAKFYASEAAFRAANNAIQLHGGWGYLDDYPLERYLRDAKVATLLEGTSQIHRLLIGRAATGINAFV